MFQAKKYEDAKYGNTNYTTSGVKRIMHQKAFNIKESERVKKEIENARAITRRRMRKAGPEPALKPSKMSTFMSYFGKKKPNSLSEAPSKFKEPVAAPVSNFKAPAVEFKAPTEEDQEAKMEALSNEYNKESELENEIHNNRESIFGNNGNSSVNSKNNLSDEEIKQFVNSIEPKLKTKGDTQRIKNALNKMVDAKMVNTMKQKFTKKNS
jgi:hypothetical protein